MGLTKQYLRYVASAVFGLIGSQKGNIVFVTLRGEKGRYVAVPASASASAIPHAIIMSIS